MIEEKKSVARKEEREIMKKTAEAHGTLSEETAEKKSKDSKKVSEELLEKEVKKEKEKEVKKVEKRIELFEKTEHEKRGMNQRELAIQGERESSLLSWEPKTKLGIEVMTRSVKSFDEILDSNRKILEEQIVDYLLKLDSDLISIGQSKGKFGGGKRRAWRQTQRKTKQGSVPTFSTMAVVGDKAGHIGLGVGKSKETLPARDKAARQARLNIIRIKRGCGSFDCACNEPHSVPFKVIGKGGSCVVTLIPAPQGTGLVAAGEIKKILNLAGIHDVYTKTFGKQRTTFNLAKACMEALKRTNPKVEETNDRK